MSNKELLEYLKEMIDAWKFTGEYGDELVNVDYLYRFIKEQTENLDDSLTKDGGSL